MSLRNNRLKFNKILAILFIAFFFAGQISFAADNNDTKSTIEKKNKELLEVSGQIKVVQDQLDQTRNQKQTLNNELNQINTNIKKIDLGIKSSKIVVEKLNLEISDTQDSISDSEAKIRDKKLLIMDSLRQLQQEDDSNNPIILFLKNNDLAQSMSEAQNMIDFQDKISIDIEDLRLMQEELNKNLDIASNKKKQKESENKNLNNQKIIVEETKKYRQQLLNQTKNKEKNYQQSLTDLQKRQEQIATELDALESAARQTIRQGNLPSARSGLLAMPIAGRLTQGYGATSFARSASRSGGYRSAWHNGIDFGAPIGTPIYAAEAGAVSGVGNQDVYCYKGAYGKFITINHDNNLTTLYAHLSLQVVSEGQRVSRGQLIGYSGNTGFSTGAHLHYTVYSTPTFRIGPAKLSCGPRMPYGGDLNPLNYLDLNAPPGV